MPAHVCYDSLSHKFRAFCTSFSYVFISCSVSQVESQTQLRRAMEDETQVLEKNKTWDVLDLL